MREKYYDIEFYEKTAKKSFLLLVETLLRCDYERTFEIMLKAYNRNREENHMGNGYLMGIGRLFDARSKDDIDYLLSNGMTNDELAEVMLSWKIENKQYFFYDEIHIKPKSISRDNVLRIILDSLDEDLLSFLLDDADGLNTILDC